jgi:hypothetical protein
MTDLYDPLLGNLAATVDDLEMVRKAAENRLRQLTRTGVDKDGTSRGFGLPEDHLSVQAATVIVDGLKRVEHQAILLLQRQLRTHPLHPWIKAQNGLGEKTVARLLAAIQDPYWNDRHDRPRTVGELFKFCGVAGPGQRKRKGERVTWSPEARMRLHVIIEPIVKNRRSPYRAVYDQARVKYAEKTHTEVCVRCGPAGKPALVGSPWPPAHQHAAAMRLVKRAVLRGLWEESRRLHGADELKVAA